MTSTQLQQQLEQLDELIRLEREYAIKLKVKDLKDLQERKAELLQELQKQEGHSCEDQKKLISRLKGENRRNARLLASTLNILRQTMQNCCREITPVLYGHMGTQVQKAAVGVLHVGRV